MISNFNLFYIVFYLLFKKITETARNECLRNVNTLVLSPLVELFCIALHYFVNFKIMTNHNIQKTILNNDSVYTI